MQSQSFSVAQDSFDFVFNKFDTSLGTLTGATISLNYSRSDGYITADNEGASPATISFTHTTNVAVDADVAILDWSNAAGGARLLSSTSTRATTTFSNITIQADSDVGPADFTGSDSYQGSLPTANITSSGSFADTSQFEGSGTISVPVSVTQGTSVTGSGAIAQASQPALVSGTFTVTYTYEPTAPVPEPSAAMLSMLSVGALIMRRRRSLS